MKKILSLILVCFIVQLSACAIEEVSLGKMPKEKIELSNKPKSIKGSLLISDDEVLSQLIDLQKKKDLEDIEALWKGTVDNNKVIGFAIKKLATPESQRRIHSSLMAKTLSAVISGSSLAPSVMGADPTIRTSAFAVGRIAQALINKKTTPQEVPLTDTEMIELAGLVEDLQDEIIGAYYNYKNSLNQIKDTRSRLILYNKNYHNALMSGDLLDITISSSMYDNMVLEEYKNMQDATKYHLELQRLAGKKTVDKLNLYQYNFNSALFKNSANPRKRNKKVQKKVDKSLNQIDKKSNQGTQQIFFLKKRNNVQKQTTITTEYKKNAITTRPQEHVSTKTPVIVPKIDQKNVSVSKKAVTQPQKQQVKKSQPKKAVSNVQVKKQVKKVNNTKNDNKKGGIK